jgi:hypothetical protein
MIINNELGSMWRKVVVAYFKELLFGWRKWGKPSNAAVECRT